MKVKNSVHGSYISYGKTETIDNNLNPKWMKYFQVNYYFEGTQWLLFEVWDDDESNSELIGKAEVKLSDIMRAPKKQFTCALVHKKHLRGTLQIKVDSVNVSEDAIDIHFNADLVSKKYFCCGFDNPYLLIERARLMNDEDVAEKLQAEKEAQALLNLNVPGRRRKNKKKSAQELEADIEKTVKNVDLVKDWVRIFKTDFIFNQHAGLNFDSIKMKLTDFCANNKTLPIRINAYSYENSGDHKLYGRVITSVREIEMGRTTLELISKRNKIMGHLYVEHFKVDMKPSLLNYLKHGWKLDCSMAIDFTLSNGPIFELKSKHRQDKQRKDHMNPYEKAIYEVGGVLQKFACKGQFTMYGFGGIPRYLSKETLTARDESELVRCWNLVGELDPDDSVLGEELKVDGTMGALGIYHRAVTNTTLAGPTYFSGILRRFLNSVLFGMETT